MNIVNNHEANVLGNRRRNLQTELSRIKQENIIVIRATRIIKFVAISLALFFYAKSFEGKVSNDIILGTLMLAMSILFPIILKPNYKSMIRIQDIENELDLHSIGDSSMEQRAEKLFRLHQYELKKYYDQALSQSSWIFVTGIFSIIGGFIIIGWAMYLVMTKSVLEGKIIISLFGIASGILANFIGVMYIRMYSKTINSLTEFHNRLLGTHHLHFTNFLTSKISNNDLREDILAHLVKTISKIK